MAWPSGPVAVTDLDQTTDSPASARGQILAIGTGLNDVIAAQPGTFIFDSPYLLTLSSGVLTESAWESFGPTGSGADNIWTGIDNVPTNARGLILRGNVEGSSAGSSRITCGLHARKTGTAGGNGPGNSVCFNDVANTSPVVTLVGARGETQVNCDTSRRVDLFWFADATTKQAYCYLMGYFR